MAIGIVHFEVFESSGKQNCLIRVVVSDTVVHDVLHRLVASGVADQGDTILHTELHRLDEDDLAAVVVDEASRVDDGGVGEQVAC